MASSIYDVKCARCHVGVVVEQDNAGQEHCVCPKCRAGDTRERVMSEVGKYVEEMTARYLQNSFKNAVRGSKFLKFETKPIPHRNHRFVVDLNLR